MKKLFNEPAMTVVEFAVEDVITTSGVNCANETPEF